MWKWLDSGDVEFRIHARSRLATDRSPLVRAGFRVFGPRERRAFIASTLRRMARLTAAALDDGASIRAEAEKLTARRGRTDSAHERLAKRFGDR